MLSEAFLIADYFGQKPNAQGKRPVPFIYKAFNSKPIKN